MCYFLMNIIYTNMVQIQIPFCSFAETYSATHNHSMNSSIILSIIVPQVYSSFSGYTI